MSIKQISVFVETKPRHLKRNLHIFADHKHSVRVTRCFDTGDYGIARFIVDEPERALAVLQDRGSAVTLTDVVCAEMIDEPGELARVFGILADANINVNSKTNVITIDNIKISITNVYIDPSSIKDAKQTKNIFNQLTIGDFTAAQSELEKKLINDAKEKGIIETAQKSAEETLKALFGEAINGYTVVFNWQ